jgi:hypothetical protein
VRKKVRGGQGFKCCTWIFFPDTDYGAFGDVELKATKDSLRARGCSGNLFTYATQYRRVFLMALVNSTKLPKMSDKRCLHRISPWCTVALEYLTGFPIPHISALGRNEQILSTQNGRRVIAMRRQAVIPHRAPISDEW